MKFKDITTAFLGKEFMGLPWTKKIAGIYVAVSLFLTGCLADVEELWMFLPVLANMGLCVFIVKWLFKDEEVFEK